MIEDASVKITTRPLLLRCDQVAQPCPAEAPEHQSLSYVPPSVNTTVYYRFTFSQDVKSSPIKLYSIVIAIVGVFTNVTSETLTKPFLVVSKDTPRELTQTLVSLKESVLMAGERSKFFYEN